MKQLTSDPTNLQFKCNFCTNCSASFTYHFSDTFENKEKYLYVTCPHCNHACRHASSTPYPSEWTSEPPTKEVVREVKAGTEKKDQSLAIILCWVLICINLIYAFIKLLS